MILVWNGVLMSGIAFSYSWLVKYMCEFLLENEGNRMVQITSMAIGHYLSYV